MSFPFQHQIVKLLLVFSAMMLFTMMSWHRSESTLSPAQLHNKENKTLTKLVALKMQIESARSEIEVLDDLVQKNLREKAVKERELVHIRADLSASNKELGKWVEFSYRHGYVSVLDVLVSSADFNDFINRSLLLWAIVDQQARACEKNRSLRIRPKKA